MAVALFKRDSKGPDQSGPFSHFIIRRITDS
jgi:hypothetical protein